MTPHDAEVADIFEVPFDVLMKPENYAERSVEWGGKQRQYFEMYWEEWRIWGVTAAMIVNLAHRLDRRFLDLDEAIENRVGVSIREIFSSRGEAEFRRIETVELEQTTTQSDLVVATGGGAFSSGENRRERIA